MVLPKPAPGFDPDGPGGADPFSIDPGHVVDSYTGSASWYGSEGHGGPTASGERFNMYAMTAAHKTLKLGTWILVTNLRNGKQVVVRINDRGPYAGGRILDLSYAAASALDFVGSGVTTVRIDVLDGKR
ncbi:MAG: septal ring lytic transglycosylase RlpA family protein [Armatimonadetes bacterium]|nr:septal ring lytic transglycosylase RlpA family protein [Armatimonadota bacterium]